ncbi:13075_t:CDS:2, partial [Funneliformis geosporum]
PLPYKAEASFSKIKIPNKVHQYDILLHTYNQDGTAVRYLLKAGELEEDHRYRATDPYWNLYVFKIKRVVIGRNPSQPVLYYLENKPIESTAHLIRQNPKKPFKYEKLQDVRKSMSETVSTGQLGYEPILNIFWPELTRDM